MNLPRPPERYDMEDQAQLRSIIVAEDKRNLKKLAPVLLRSPNGTIYKLSVADDGTLSAIVA